MTPSIFRTVKLPGLGILFALWTATVSAQTTNYTFSFPANVAVPDGNVNGLALVTDLTGLGGSITNLTVSFNLSGGYNGDLYGYLRGPNGGFAVLLNRSGVTTGDAFGYANTGFKVTFDDSAGNSNIHFYQTVGYNLNGSGQLTDSWSSDGRAIDPLSGPSLFDSTKPTALLTSFNGTDPNGTWTLFLADLSSGGQSTILNWGLNITVVPEPATYAVLGIGLVLFRARNRWRG